MNADLPVTSACVMFREPEREMLFKVCEIDWSFAGVCLYSMCCVYFK